MSTERLKVLFITHTFPGNTEELRGDAIYLLADALAEQGVDVRVVAPDMNDRNLAGGESVKVDRFRVVRSAGSARKSSQPAPPAIPGAAARASRRRAMKFLGAEFGSAVQVRRDFEPDIVHAHWWFPSGLVGSWVSSLASLPLITSLHGFDPQHTVAGSPARPLFRHVMARSAAVTVDSNALARKVSALHGTAAPIVAPLPMSMDAFTPAASRENRVAISYTGAAGSQSPWVWTAASLAAMGYSVDILVEADMIQAVEEQLRGAAPALQARVVSSSDRSAVASVLAAARCCVMVGATEKQRGIVSAAMLSGAPPILVNSDALEEVATEEAKVAFRVEAGDAEHTARALVQLIQNEAALRERGEAARMFALGTLAPDSCAGRMLAIYLRTLDDAAA